MKKMLEKATILLASSLLILILPSSLLVNANAQLIKVPSFNLLNLTQQPLTPPPMLNFTKLNPSQLQNAMDKEVTDLKKDGDALKAEINGTNLAHTGQVENLINKVYYYEGQISTMGGGTWAYLHDVQDTLLAKIKATGQSGFTTAELAAIDAFGSNVATSKQEHPSSNVFG